MVGTTLSRTRSRPIDGALLGAFSHETQPHPSSATLQLTSAHRDLRKTLTRFLTSWTGGPVEV